MRIYAVLFLTLSFSFECLAQVDFNQTVKLAEKKNCKAPVKSRMYLSTHEGFCLRAIYINEDSTFKSAGSCESHSDIITGRWKIVGDSIELSSYKKHHEEFICNIKIIEPKKSDRIKIYVFDKTGTPYENFGFSLFNNPARFKDSIKRFYTSASAKECDSCENNVFSNYNGQYIIETKGYKYLEIDAFSILQTSRFAFLTKDLPSEFSITVDFNEFQHTGEIEYLNFEKPVKYFYSKERLIIGESVFEATN